MGLCRDAACSVRHCFQLHWYLVHRASADWRMPFIIMPRSFLAFSTNISWKKDDIAVFACPLRHASDSFPLMSCKTSFPDVMGRTSRRRTFVFPTSRLGPREDKGPSSGRHLSLLFYGIDILSEIYGH